MRQVVYLLLSFALLCAANMHLPLLQVVAWARMLVTYSEGRSFSEAAEMTFDGEHPCPMCKAIKKQQEKKSDLKCVSFSPAPIYFLHTPAPWVQHMDLLGILPDTASLARMFGILPERMPPRSVA